MADHLHVVAQFDKNKAERVRVALDRYREHDLVDVRVLAQLTAGSDHWFPTKRGISVAVAKLPQLIAALQSAQSLAIEAGLLERMR